MGQAMKVQLRDKSGIRLYRFIVEDVDRHGNVRVYFRRKGQPKIRLFEMPGTAAFDAEYQRAFNGEVKLPSASQHTVWMPGTLGWLCGITPLPFFRRSTKARGKPGAGSWRRSASGASMASAPAPSGTRRWSRATSRSCAMKRRAFPRPPITDSRHCGSFSRGRVCQDIAMPTRTRRAM